MTRIELTIKAGDSEGEGYVPNWGLWEFVREFVQNGRDAEVELGAAMTVDYTKENKTLRICNQGTVLPHEALLLGHTSKAGRSDTIGHWGEGLKLAMLVACRKGYDVKIRSGSEVWEPSIVMSERFKAKVLAVDIAGGRKDEQRVRVEIKGIEAEEWEEFRERFLFLDKDDKRTGAKVMVPDGSLLLADHMRGRIYVKGVFVEYDATLAYGYDLRNADLDRDRRMVERWTRNYAIKGIWLQAVAQRPDLTTGFIKMLDEAAPDTEGLSQYSTVPVPVLDAVVAEFRTRFGDDAIPVKNIGESKEIEHLGKTGIVVPEKMQLVLSARLGTLESVKKELQNAITKRYGWHDLGADERTYLDLAVTLVNGVEAVELSQVEVVDFRSPTLMGQYNAQTRIVSLARRVVGDKRECLETVVHEVAHATGGDGEHSHVANMERIWSGIVAKLLDGILP